MLYLENDSFCIKEEIDCSGDECKIKLEFSLAKDDEVEFEFEEYANAFKMLLEKQRYKI